MSHRPTLITDELVDYINENFSSEDKFLAKLRVDAKKSKIPDICISPEQGAFLQFFLKAVKAKYVLEIGTLAGYSAITMARSLPEGGKLISVEINAKNAEFARKKIKEAGLESKIEVHTASALQFLENYRPEFQFDFIFIDAEKTEYKKYFLSCSSLIRKGGIIAADNALAFGEIVNTDKDREIFKEIEAIRDFNRFIKSSADFKSCLLTVGDGMIMSVKQI